MTSKKMYEYTNVCEACNRTFTRMLYPSATLPKTCSKSCGRVAQQRRRNERDKMDTYFMSPEQKQLHKLLRRTQQTQPATVDESNYRTRGGYKAPKPAPAKTRYNEFEVFCPHPYKLPYRTFEEAQAFIDMTHGDDEFLAPYKCKCGGVHIGHSYPRSHPLHPANRNRNEGVRQHG